VRERQSTAQIIGRRRSLAYAEFARHYCVPRRPVIFADAISAWPATSRWTPQYVAQRIGDEQIEAEGVTYSVRQFIELVVNSSPASPVPYVRLQDVAATYAHLAVDLRPPIIHSLPNWADSHLLPPSTRRCRRRDILIGGYAVGAHAFAVGTTGLHTFASQVYGVSDISLHPPTHALRPLDPGGEPGTAAGAAARAPARPSDVSALDPTTIALRPGETLFVPAGWSASSQTSAPSISVLSSTVNGTNWADVAADIHRRVLRSSNASLASLFGLYARGIARIKTTADDVIADAHPNG